MNITLLAGEKGLRNLVSWTHIVETIEASSFLDGGEIVFTTGLGINHKIDPAMIFYSDMGIYQLLMGIEDNEVILEYYEKTIHPLVDYDKKNNSNLTDVLKCYLTHDGSVKETADELFVHRNTINYKLNKIKELLDMDLSALNTRFQLMIDFMLQDMI